jgi:hypothetical protein
MSEVMSENVAKLIAILATFSRTGHNWAALDFSGNADLPGRIGTGHYQPDGTFTDWQSGGSRVRVPSPPPRISRSQWFVGVADTPVRWEFRQNVATQRGREFANESGSLFSSRTSS